MMFVVIGVIVFKVLPIFENVLKSLGSDLSQYAYTFMRCGQIFSFIGFCILLCVLLLMIAFYVYAKIIITCTNNISIGLTGVTKKCFKIFLSR